MVQKTILIIEDEEAIRAMVSNFLSMANFQVMEAESGEQAFNLIYNNKPDLILLDWMLPTISGIEILRKLRRDDLTKSIPVIMLTAKSTEDNLISGLKSGADDYITKPFSPKELLARIESLLRRMGSDTENTIQQGDLVINPTEHQVYISDQPIVLGPTEYKLLDYFMRSPNLALSRTQLLDNVWSGDTYIDERTVDVHIRRLRKALADQAPADINTNDYIETIRGTGYRFNARKTTS